MKTNKYFIVIILAVFSLSLTGCWDYKEIEKRGYVLGIAIDKASAVEDKVMNDIKLDNKNVGKMPVEKGKIKYAYTIQIPIIARAQAKPTGQGGGPSGQERTWNLTFMGNSFFEVVREFSTRLDYAPFFEHLQAIVISEDVAKMGIVEPLDLLFRDPEIRRRTRVFITPQNAFEFLEVSPKIDDYSAMYLASLPLNAYKTSRMAHKTDLGEVVASLHIKRDFALPMVVCNKEEIKSAGAALFKEGKMVGWLGEIETAYAKWITDVALGGEVVIDTPNRPNEQLTLEIKNVKTDIKPIIKGEEITMSIKTKAQLNIAEQMGEAFLTIFNEEFIKEAERIAEEQITKEMADNIDFVRREYGVDVFEFGTALKRYEPDTWYKVRDEWHDIFPVVKTDIKVEIEIKQVGLIK